VKVGGTASDLRDRRRGLDVLYARSGATVVAIGVTEPEGQTDLLVELATLAFGRATTT
jgi:hypothetical protein